MGLSDNTQFKIRISADEMEAFLFLAEPAPGTAVYTQQEVIDLLHAGRVVYGIDEEAIAHMLAGRVFGREVCVARGTKPVDGKDGFFQYNFSMDLNSRPAIREDGSVDYWSIHAVEIVEQGQVIATYQDPVDGKDGTSVTGRTILAKKGRPQPPLKGKGFTRSEDGHSYLADRSGKIEKVQDWIQILEVYEVHGDVDVHTGKIDFRGDVIVHGNVTPGAIIKATGSVTVDGICEACVINAGKDIVLRGGVLGAHKAVIYSKGNIQAKFFEYCTVEAEGSIGLNSALSCNMISYDKITLDGKRASIVGGQTYAVGGILADTIGNQNEVKTSIQVGVSTEILKGIVDIQNRLAESNAMLGKVTEGLKQFDEMAKERGMNVSSDERRISLLRTKMTVQAQIASDEKALEHYNVITERGKGASIQVVRNIYPGTVVTIDQTVHPVKEEQTSVEFVKRENNVIMLSLKDVLA